MANASTAHHHLRVGEQPHRFGVYDLNTLMAPTAGSSEDKLPFSESIATTIFYFRPSCLQNHYIKLATIKLPRWKTMKLKNKTE